MPSGDAPRRAARGEPHLGDILASLGVDAMRLVGSYQRRALRAIARTRAAVWATRTSGRSGREALTERRRSTTQRSLWATVLVPSIPPDRRCEASFLCLPPRRLRPLESVDLAVLGRALFASTAVGPERCVDRRPTAEALVTAPLVSPGTDDEDGSRGEKRLDPRGDLSCY